jgi:hypothetical protein
MEPESVSTLTPEAEEVPYFKNTKEPIRVEKYGSVRLPIYN